MLGASSQIIVILIAATVPIIHISLSQFGQIVGQRLALIDADRPGNLCTDGLDPRRDRIVGGDGRLKPNAVPVLCVGVYARVAVQQGKVEV